MRATRPRVPTHGVTRVQRPAQWLIVAALLISWTAAGVFMFDFISDEQLSSLRRVSSDPMTAVNEAVEDFTSKINQLQDVVNNAHDYVPTVMADPGAAVDRWADVSTSYLRLGGGALDVMSARLRSFAASSFHTFEDLLDAVILKPLETAGEAVASVSDRMKVMAESLTGTFTGVKAWIPSPVEVASDVLEGAQKLKSSMAAHVSRLLSADEGGVSELNFDPMKVVTDTVEEISERRDMFLSYLSHIMMEDKEDAPHVIRRKGEFLPPKEKGVA